MPMFGASAVWQTTVLSVNKKLGYHAMMSSVTLEYFCAKITTKWRCNVNNIHYLHHLYAFYTER